MAKNWIVVTTEDNFAISIKHNIIGVSFWRRSILMSVKKGDNLVFYITRKRAGYRYPHERVCEFASIGVVVGTPFESQEEIWEGPPGEVYPYRVQVKIYKSKTRVRVSKVVNQLSFIKNKERWGVSFLASMREISDNDFKTIKKMLAD